jgi:hypothetical protein
MIYRPEHFTVGGSASAIGLGVGSIIQPSPSNWTGNIGSIGIGSNGQLYIDSNALATYSPYGPGDVVAIALKNGFMWYRVNNSFWNGGTGDPVAGTGGFAIPTGSMYFMATVTPTASVTVNTIAPFVHTPPTGYQAWGSPPAPVAVSSWEILSKGVLNNVQSFDIRLPDGYSSFQFQIVGARFPVEDTFCTIVSYDNGATFLSDGVNYDTYGNASTLLYQSTAGTYVYTNPTFGGVQDPASWLSSDYDPGSFYGYAGLSRAAHFDQYWDVFPGDVNTFFRAIIRGMSDQYYAGLGGGFGFLVGATTVSSLSTIPNPKGRVNYMRFGGFGCMSGFDTTKTLSGTWYLLGLPQAGPPPFNPTTLFAGGATGGWWDPSDHSTTFQDIAGTIPAKADGQTVQMIKDKSGNGNHLVGIAGCTLHSSGSQWFLLFDGVANFINAAFTITQPLTRITAIQQVTWLVVLLYTMVMCRIVLCFISKRPLLTLCCMLVYQWVQRLTAL